MRYVAIILALFLVSGCTMKQVRQEFIGYSADDVAADKDKQVQHFDMDADVCIDKIAEALKALKAIVRIDKKNLFIVADNFQKALRSCIDTTRAGILIISEGPGKCRVEISSGNRDLGMFISDKLSKSLRPQPKEAKI